VCSFVSPCVCRILRLMHARGWKEHQQRKFANLSGYLCAPVVLYLITRRKALAQTLFSVNAVKLASSKDTNKLVHCCLWLEAFCLGKRRLCPLTICALCFSTKQYQINFLFRYNQIKLNMLLLNVLLFKFYIMILYLLCAIQYKNCILLYNL
jgi:hypothetical protein